MVSKRKSNRGNYAQKRRSAKLAKPNAKQVGKRQFVQSLKITAQAIKPMRIFPVVKKVLAIKEYNDKITGAPRFTVRLLEYAQDKQDAPIGCTDLRTFNTIKEAVEYIKSK